MAEQDPTVLALLEKQITTLGETLGRRLDSSEANANRRFDELASEIGDVKEQTTQTNGRVTTLEKARERAQGVIFAFRWLPVVLSSALAAGFTILIMALSGGLGH